jgi:hypothetical protein
VGFFIMPGTEGDKEHGQQSDRDQNRQKEGFLHGESKPG